MKLTPALVLVALLLFHAIPLSKAFASPGLSGSGNVIEPVLRFRGGPSFENNYRNTGPAWLAGGSAGVLIARTMIVAVGVDRISLDATRAVTPLTLQIELGRPFHRWITPRLYGGWGAYPLQTASFPVFDFFGAPPHVDTRTDTYWGGYLGVGFSLRMTRSTMLDLGVRSQHASNEYYGLSLDTIDTGLTLRL